MLVDAKTALKYSGIPRATFYRLVKKGKLPYHIDDRVAYRERGAIKFDLAEIDAFLSQQRASKKLAQASASNDN